MFNWKYVFICGVYTHTHTRMRAAYLRGVYYMLPFGPTPHATHPTPPRTRYIITVSSHLDESGCFTNRNINIYRMMMICTSVGRPNTVGRYIAWIFIRHHPLYINNVTTFVAARTIAFRMGMRVLFLKTGWKLFFFSIFFLFFFFCI